MSSKTESDKLKEHVLEFLCNDIQKFLFIDCSSSGLNINEIFSVIKGLQLDAVANILAETLRNYQGRHNQDYYKWNNENLENIIKTSPNLLIMDLPEEEEIDKDRVKKILDIVDGYLLKKMILVSKKKDFFVDLLYFWIIKAGVLKLEKTFTPIHNMVLKNDLGDITRMVSAGTDINLQNGNKDTALHLAVEKGAKNLVLDLLRHGADVNIENIQNRTVLHIALEKRFFDIVNIILTENIDVNLKDWYGYTALHLAARIGNVDIIKKLVEKGADINCEDIFYYTPLIYACEGGKDAVEYILPLVKHLNIQGTLVHAAKTGNGDVINMLINYGANVNLKNHKGLAPLHAAAFYGNLNAVNALLHHGADPNSANNNNYTPLHSAVSKGHKEIVQRLLKAGSRVDAISKGENIIHIAAEHAGTDVIDILIAHGIDVNVKNHNGQTALILACQDYNRLDVVRCLISQKANPNIKEKHTNESALHVACAVGNLDIVKALLDAGANVNDVTVLNDTPLHFAIRKGYEKIVVELVEKGSDVTAVNSSGESALDIARKRQSKEIVEFLSKKMMTIKYGSCNTMTLVTNL